MIEVARHLYLIIDNILQALAYARNRNNEIDFEYMNDKPVIN